MPPLSSLPSHPAIDSNVAADEVPEEQLLRPLGEEVGTRASISTDVEAAVRYSMGSVVGKLLEPERLNANAAEEEAGLASALGARAEETAPKYGMPSADLVADPFVAVGSLDVPIERAEGGKHVVAAEALKVAAQAGVFECVCEGAVPSASPPQVSPASMPGKRTLWALSAGMSPSQHVVAALSPFIPQCATSSATLEGVSCATCSFYIEMQLGATVDGAGAVRCSRCASRAGLLAPSIRPPAKRPPPKAEVPAATVARHSAERIAMRDVASALMHVQQLLRREDHEARQLRAGMAAEGLCAIDIAARGVLSAFDEAVAILTHGGDDTSQRQEVGLGWAEGERGECEHRAPRDGSAGISGAELFSRLLEAWEAEIPSGLLAVCLQPPVDSGGSTRAAADSGGSTSLLSTARRLRQVYLRRYTAAGYQLDVEQQACR